MNWIQMLIQLLPTFEQAINALIANGHTPEQATAALISHNTAGQPNCPELSEHPPTPEQVAIDHQAATGA